MWARIKYPVKSETDEAGKQNQSYENRGGIADNEKHSRDKRTAQTAVVGELFPDEILRNCPPNKDTRKDGCHRQHDVGGCVVKEIKEIKTKYPIIR